MNKLNKNIFYEKLSFFNIFYHFLRKNMIFSVIFNIFYIPLYKCNLRFKMTFLSQFLSKRSEILTLSPILAKFSEYVTQILLTLL